MNDGSLSKIPLLPFTLGGARPGIRLQPPLLGEHTGELLAALGYDALAIGALAGLQGAQATP